MGVRAVGRRRAQQTKVVAQAHRRVHDIRCDESKVGGQQHRHHWMVHAHTEKAASGLDEVRAVLSNPVAHVLNSCVCRIRMSCTE